MPHSVVFAAVASIEFIGVKQGKSGKNNTFLDLNVNILKRWGYFQSYY